MTITTTKQHLSDKAGALYTDYVLSYYRFKGTNKGCLGLLTFCSKLRRGIVVKVSETSFKLVK